MEPLISIKNISKVYPMRGGDVYALKDVSLDIEPGAFVAVVGKSGSGKSTLLYLLGLLTTPSQGEFRFGGRAVERLTDLERSHIRGRDIGFVFQSFHLVSQLNVLENVILASRYATGLDRREVRKRANELIDRIGLSHRVSHRPIELSNGEMQRVAIARALLTSPSLILADEPTGNLDEENGNEVYDVLKALNAEGKTIILVTHDMQLAGRIGRCVRLKDGEVQNGSVSTAG